MTFTYTYKGYIVYKLRSTCFAVRKGTETRYFKSCEAAQRYIIKEA